MKAGILMHSRHLETIGWEQLVWGVPTEDSVGSLPKVVELVLDEPECSPYQTIIFGGGPSTKDSMTEGEYTKKYLLDRLDDLREFPRFAQRLGGSALSNLRGRLEGIVVTEPFTRSVDEIAIAAQMFEERQVTRVTQVTAASHAPRCVQLQSAARATGQIPASQKWSLVADDRCYESANPLSTMIFEPPHRGDDPMRDAKTSITDVLGDYHYGLPPEDKEALIALIGAYMAEHAQPANAHTVLNIDPGVPAVHQSRAA